MQIFKNPAKMLKLLGSALLMVQGLHLMLHHVTPVAEFLFSIF